MTKSTSYFRILLILLMTLVSTLSFAQKEAFVWYFGNRLGLDFNTNPPTLLNTSPNAGTGDTDEAHATISDADGNFLFYTNGLVIWDKNGNQMPNGAGLTGNISSTQCATIFLRPGSTTEYFVITTPLTQTTNQVRYNVVDITANGGLGDIKAPVASNKNQVLPSCPSHMMEAVVSVPHFNGTDIWVIAHTGDDFSTGGTNEGGSFVVWLVTSGGIAYHGTYTVGFAPPAMAFPEGGGISILKSNTCYNRIFMSYYFSGRIEGFAFDNATGVVGNWPAPVNAPLVLDAYRSGGSMTAIGTNTPYGLEISPNNRYLYATLSGESGIRAMLQYDLLAGTGSNADIENSCANITPGTPLGVRYGQLMIGPNGKIYHSIHYWSQGGRDVAVIDAPNSAGAAANYTEPSINWTGGGGRGSSMGLTSFHKGFLSGRAAITSSLTNLEQICLGDPVDFTAITAGDVVSYQWNIDKNLNNTIDYTTGPTILHTYGATGVYDIELIVVDGCGYTYTSTSQVQVIPSPSATGSVDCSANPVIGFSVDSPDPAYSYVWFSNAAATVPISAGNFTRNMGTTSGTVYLKPVQLGASTSTTVNNYNNLTNGMGGFPDSYSASGTTSISFTVNKSDLTLETFNWATADFAYAGTNQFSNFSIVLRNTTTSTDVWTNSRNGLLVRGPGAGSRSSFTETVNQVLPPGNYSITIVPSNGGGPARKDGTCNSNTNDAQSALTFNTTATNCIVTSLVYDLAETVYTTTYTNVPCARVQARSWDCVLPVTWLSIAAASSPYGNTLSWSTAAETNNKYFIVHRSQDGVNWEALAPVPSKVNARSISKYSYQDSYSGSAYYKVQQIDVDGGSSFSGIAKVTMPDDKAELTQVQISPNPGTGLYSVSVNSDTFGAYQVTDLSGALVKKGNFQGGGFILDLSEMAKGLYILHFPASAIEPQRIILE
jgi:hypothetical protein